MPHREEQVGVLLWMCAALTVALTGVLVLIAKELLP